MFYTKQINNQSINNWYIYFFNHNLASKKEFRYVISARVSIPIYTCITPTLRLPACLFLNIFSQLWNFLSFFSDTTEDSHLDFCVLPQFGVLHRAFRFYTIQHFLPVCLLGVFKHYLSIKDIDFGGIHVISLRIRKHLFAIIWPKYCRYGVKHYIINQSLQITYRAGP